MARKRDIKRVDAIARELGMSDDQRDILHDEIHGYNLAYEEIRRRAQGVMEDFPRKRDKRK